MDFEISKIVCKQCGFITNSDEVIKQKIQLPNGGYHLKASCPECKKYIKFLTHKEV